MDYPIDPDTKMRVGYDCPARAPGGDGTKLVNALGSLHTKLRQAKEAVEKGYMITTKDAVTEALTILEDLARNMGSR